MNASASQTELYQGLELLSHLPEKDARATPLLFVHGAFAGAWVWQEHYLPYFAKRGWRSYALSLAGHGGSLGRERLDLISLHEYVQNVRQIIEHLPAKPIVIGHSMGGMVVQKLLEQFELPAAVLMSSVPPTGLLAASTYMLITRPMLFLELNKTLTGGFPQFNTLREALFAQAVDEQDLQRYFSHMQPESTRAVWDMSWFDLPHFFASDKHPPVLVMGAEQDRLVPVPQVHQTARYYDTEAVIFARTGHGMMLEQNWQETAACIARWLEKQGF